MNTKNPRAFPRPAYTSDTLDHENEAQDGMTLRDYFAAKTLQGDQHRRTRRKRPRIARIPFLATYLENINKAKNKASAATARATLADLLMAASVPKTRERL